MLQHGPFAVSATVFRIAAVARQHKHDPRVAIARGQHGPADSLTHPCVATVARYRLPPSDDGVTYGTRHQYSGGGGNQLCLKNSAGDQGGVRQGGQDSNDMIVPIRMDHTNYNGIPGRNNLMRNRQDYIIPCAKCKYAKSCFEESGVAECPSGYHKMYTGYLFGGHQGHSGNNNRICVDKNPADNDREVYPACAVNRFCLQSLLRLSPHGFTHSCSLLQLPMVHLIPEQHASRLHFSALVHPQTLRATGMMGLCTRPLPVMARAQACCATTGWCPRVTCAASAKRNNSCHFWHPGYQASAGGLKRSAIHCRILRLTPTSRCCTELYRKPQRLSLRGAPCAGKHKNSPEHKNRKTTTARHSVIDTLSPLVQSPPPSARTHYCGMMLETTCWVRTPSSSMNQGGLGQLAPLKGYEQLCSSYRFGLLPSRPPPLLDLSCSRRDVPRVIGDVAPTTPC